MTTNENKIKKILKESFKKLKEDWSILIVTPAAWVDSVNSEAIKILQNQGYDGIYVSLSRGYYELVNMLINYEVEYEKLVFIDGISTMYNSKRDSSESITYIKDPLSLEDIIKAITKTSQKIKSKKKFLILDSLSTVLLYNSAEKTINFNEQLAKTLRANNITGVVVSVTEGFSNKRMLNELKKSSYEVIELK